MPSNVRFAGVRARMQSMNQPGKIRPGTLWVVATPIGNLDDLSPRARRVLETAPVIAAEDTRVSRRLLAQRSARVKWISLHDHNETEASEAVIDCLRGGTEVALVSDAGTPLISDPGYRLVAAAQASGIPVRAVPGPCAAVAALSVAGLPPDRFRFEGFLPAAAGARRRRLGELAAESASLIFYAPARNLVAILGDIGDAFGAERPAALARELTKQHETVRRDSVGGLLEWVGRDDNQRRGEAVLIVGGNPQPSPSIDASALARELALELPPSRAAKVLARLTGMSRKEAFELVEAKRA